MTTNSHRSLYDDPYHTESFEEDDDPEPPSAAQASFEDLERCDYYGELLKVAA